MTLRRPCHTTVTSPRYARCASMKGVRALNDLPDPLARATPCEEAFRRIAVHCAEAFSEALAQVQSSDDPRGPHKARVALRRLTTALDVFEPLLRRKRLAGLRAQAKGMFRALGTLRDSDVHTEGREAEPGHKGRLRRNAALRGRVRKDLMARKADTFAGRVARLTAPDGEIWRRGTQARAMRAAPLGDFAAGMLGQVWADCQSRGGSVSAMDPATRHEFRKDLKSMRYLAEFFAPLFPALSQDPFGTDFHDIQDALGVLNDYQVALALDGRKPPAKLPGKQTRALVAAEAIWLRLTTAPLPWDRSAPG